MYTITGNVLKAAFTAAANALHENKDMLDAMNVFPVPDGDTGINMYLTALSAAQSAQLADADVPNPSAGSVAKAAAQGALQGARGNSGVILSQLYRGFARALEGVKIAGPLEFARALSGASETAYKAIMKPKEGTILTVAREIAERAAQLTESDRAPDIALDALFAEIIRQGNKTLAKTKDMLPMLKAANVEDAGGKGYIIILNAMYSAVTGGEYVLPLYSYDGAGIGTSFTGSNEVEEDIEFAYCTELFVSPYVQGNYDFELREFLDEIGDSVVVVSDDKVIKIHVHTNDPGIVLQKCAGLGMLDGIDINNMHTQAREAKAARAAAFAKNGGSDESETIIDDLKETGFVAVANGNGFFEYFKSLGADEVINGGQSMNPGVETFIKAINAVPAKAVIVLPNNKNVILSARQAAEMCPGKDVYVVPSRSIPQGLAALTRYVHSSSAEENSVMMEEVIQQIHSGLLTRAVRDSVFEGINIHKGDAIGIIDGRIALAHRNASECLRQMTRSLVKSNGGISFLTIYYGDGIKERDAERFMAFVNKEFPDIECELAYGGQPVYRYILAAE
ncbi:MAG: DAK2 domain-containing protein [Defluviitaleaceae bacterium]|nr:DAK2 domain-containing protein [Defluviitaleaceae bacterium]